MNNQLLDEMSKHRFSVVDKQQGTVEPISEEEFRKVDEATHTFDAVQEHVRELLKAKQEGTGNQLEATLGPRAVRI